MDMNDHAYARTNFTKRRHTIKNVNRDFHEWHMGRPHYAIWAIDVDTPEIRQQVFAAEQHLAGLLLENYARKPHITLCVCGFLSDEVKQTDDFGASLLEAQLANLTRLNLKPFEIEIDALASFSSVPFFHVKDAHNSIAALHECLNLDMPRNQHDQYIPHITVGLYADAWLSSEVSLKLASFTKLDITRYSVNKISLMSYNPAEIGGVLRTIADYDFEQAKIQWHKTPPFALKDAI
ncbi:2'-5' RNA ligase family protein [Methylotenera sp.]|uniref:2'-5' RNA ligase family protein n=1 Tax=Methylotenera sp. TaxID=2051956 RepID=UPI00248A1F41|nr:2'-5' RNA ligase family protein [Methylotenera sp.]MDI1360672.1 2'-5' RNA ligase family protein [Methylotenera sp.]